MKMKIIVYFLLLSAGFTSCQAKFSREIPEKKDLLYESRDLEIVEMILQRYAGEGESGTGELVAEIGRQFLETPYVGHTLEKGDTEKLVINLRELDCTTFAENCLALARTAQMRKPNFGKFAKELEKIRYREGVRDGYASRLHYFSDWIYDNEKKKVVKDVSRGIAHLLMPNQVNFMTTHPANYPLLKDNPAVIAEIAAIEKEISGRMTWFIPKDKVSVLEGELKNGDILGLTTGIEGLDVSHVVIALRIDGHIRFIHASSKEKKVVISEETLEEYLKKSKMTTGIMVARPV